MILLRSDDVSDDLVTHELCHVWQVQHRPIRMPLSYLGTGYAKNQYERQARAAAAGADQGVVRVMTLLPDGSANDADPSRLSCPSVASDA